MYDTIEPENLKTFPVFEDYQDDPEFKAFFESVTDDDD